MSTVGGFNNALLAWNLSSIVLGVAACLYLPLIPWISESVAIVGAVSFAGLPWLACQVWRNSSARRHSTREKAVIVVAGGLACLNIEWATRLSARLGTNVDSQHLGIKSKIRWAGGGVVIALAATPWLYGTFHPSVRLLNLTDDALMVFADNYQLANLQPTSSENSLAGLFIRAPSGKRRLSARRTDGTVVDDLNTYVHAGHEHLFVPGRPRGTCFWLERTTFGRSRSGTTLREPLADEANFWTLESDVDIWFGPALSPNSSYFTGGVVTALRQGACPSTANE